MRREDVTDFFKLRRFTANPWEIVRFRKRQSSGEELQVRFLSQPPLWLEGGRADFHMFHRIFLRDEYRLDAVAASVLACVVDLGANIGVFAARAAQIARRVLAFEPNPVNFERLARNTEDRLQIAIEQSAVDGIFADHEIETCSLLKIDIEGQEYEVLYATSDATLGQIQRIHGEYHNVKPATDDTRIEALRAFLAGKGFEVEVIPHRRKPNHGMFYATQSPKYW
jgi:hypothetical protein